MPFSVSEQPTEAMDKLSIHLKIFDQEYTIKSPPEEEIFVRQASKLIQDRISFYRQTKQARKDADIIAMVALECVVARLKGDDQSQRLQEMVVDKITQLDKVISSASL